MGKPFFVPIMARWASISAFAQRVGCPEKTAREWLRTDSIPATWFAAVARAAIADGFPEITAELLAARAEARRLTRTAKLLSAHQATAA